GHPVQGGPGLHDADRVPERVQVQVEVTAVRAGGEHLGELDGIVRGQIEIADVVREVDDGSWAKAPVQVVVQQNLWHGPDLLDGGAHPAPWLASSTQTVLPRPTRPPASPPRPTQANGQALRPAPAAPAPESRARPRGPRAWTSGSWAPGAGRNG